LFVFYFVKTTTKQQQNIAFIEPGFYVKLTIDFVVVEYSNGR